MRTLARTTLLVTVAVGIVAVTVAGFAFERLYQVLEKKPKEDA
jgi:hypothetical protein